MFNEEEVSEEEVTFINLLLTKYSVTWVSLEFL